VNGIQFDLLFASLNDPCNDLKRFTKNPSAFLSSKEKINETTINSLQGKAACDNIINWVPANSKANFQIVLKAVRFWAHRRGIYSMNFGYLGGITLAVMVARVCQDYLNLQPACLLYKFFDRYAESNWHEPIQMRNASTNSNSFKSLQPALLDAVNRYSSDLLVVLTPND